MTRKVAETPCVPCLRTRSVRSTIILLALLAGCATPPTASNDDDTIERVTEKGPVKLVIRITPSKPRLSDVVQMDVDVTALPGVEIKPPEFGQAVGDFLVRDYTERPSRDSGQPDNPKTRRFEYQLEPTQAGRHLIRSVAVEFVDGRPESETKQEPVLIESEPIEVQVTSEMEGAVPDLAKLDPMLPPRPLESSFPWAWSLIFAGIFLVLGVWYWRRRRKQSASEQIRVQTPEEIAHAALASLLAEDLPKRGLFKDFYLRLTGIVRQYIEGTTGLRAPEQTTEEFLRDMRSRDVFTADRSVRLAEFLEAADMVKYAGQQPDTTQIDVSIQRAREFVEVTEKKEETLRSGVSAGSGDPRRAETSGDQSASDETKVVAGGRD